MDPTRRRATRRTLGALLACLALGACGAPAADRAPREASPSRRLRVLSYNIHHGEGTDGVFDLERLAGVIRSARPDLVALQEVDRSTGRSSGVDQAAELGRLTGLEAHFGAAMPFDGGEYGEAVLSALPVEAVRVHPLPAAPDHEPRAALELVVRAPWGESLSFAGTHLDHTRDSADRVRQARELAARLGQGDAPAILAGDLNAGPDDEPLAILLEGWTRAATGDHPTFPSGAPERAIDHVLLSPPGAFAVESVEVFHEPLASDHAPLLVILSRL